MIIIIITVVSGGLSNSFEWLICYLQLMRHKKRGRRKGIGNKLSPQIQRIVGDATLHYGNGRFKEAISVLKEGVQLEPKFPHLYHMLGLSYKALGDNKRAFQFYIIAGLLKPKDPDLWKLLFTWSIFWGGLPNLPLWRVLELKVRDFMLRDFSAAVPPNLVQLNDYVLVSDRSLPLLPLKLATTAISGVFNFSLSTAASSGLSSQVCFEPFLLEQENVSLTCHCLSKAIMADPTDISLRYLQASLYDELGDYQKAAESYEQIQQISPDNVEALKSGAKIGNIRGYFPSICSSESVDSIDCNGSNLYQKCGQIERSFAILEGYLEGHQDEADLSVINLLVSMLMQNNAYERALQQIEQAHAIYYSGKELPINLKTKSGICHIHLGDIEKAEVFCSVLQSVAHDHADLVTEVADKFMTLGHVNSALKYYNMLENDDGIDDLSNAVYGTMPLVALIMDLAKLAASVQSVLAEQDHLHHKIAQCYISTGEKVLAIKFLRKALERLENNIDARLNLASLLIEDSKEDEAISLLSPPQSFDLQNINKNSDTSKSWWLNGKIKLKLCNIYRAKGMMEDFVNTILPLVQESLYIESLGIKLSHLLDILGQIKVRRRLRDSDLFERVKKVDDLQTDGVFCGSRPMVTAADR
ncbi:general transcription factor 3C polypeptide 3 isoform X1 [Gossypium australe]|uniref:General transcription factor 3C polypeptide 3 isoform X1 n=1 Tax=Gossypium australe TaxID=47621 RepID=A0A5B6V2A3_9ROSI|nr:general transcription factor 3C polypeptide 3 isoform X1 [Gossypium australe]